MRVVLGNVVSGEGGVKTECLGLGQEVHGALQ
jgi:hypothetical protein